MYKQRKGSKLVVISIIGVSVILLIMFFASFLFSSPHTSVVTKFYKYEQKKDFVSSYSLFHPLMHERFTRETYFQQRNHIFFDHFGVQTFDFTLGKSKRHKEWKMTEDIVLQNVYEVPITKFYTSPTFGYFTIHQSVFVTKEEGDWKILWSYKEQ